MDYLANIKEILIIGTIIAGVGVWIFMRSRDISKFETRLDTVESRIGAFNNCPTDIMRLETQVASTNIDLSHHKNNVKQETSAINRRLDKIDDTLSAIVQSNAEQSRDLQHFMEMSKVESQTKLDSMNRIESGLEKSEQRQEQWVNQVAASLREIRRVTVKDQRDA